MERASRMLLCVLGVCGAAGAAAAEVATPPESRSGRLEALALEVSSAERGFARTMAERDLDGFARFVAADAVFRDGDRLLIGRQAVVLGWQGLFKPGPAPFSWEPDRVTVSDSGDTAVSSGPVHDPAGKMVGRFTTIWHKEAGPDGAWRVVVDQGVPLAECGASGR